MRNLDKKIKELFKKVGRPIKLYKNGSVFNMTYGVLQPLLYKNKLYVELQPSEMGRMDDGCCLYLGPADFKFQADDIIVVGEKEYITQRFEEVYLFGDCIYTWAVVRPCVNY